MENFYEVRSGYVDGGGNSAVCRLYHGYVVDLMFVALDRKQIVGILTLRNNSHISLLFVDEKYHRRGIGRALIEYLREYLLSEAGISKVTVNAAPYGVAFYHKLGFQDLRPEEERDGIRYTPMEFVL